MTDTIAAAVTSIADVSSRIEESFADVGNRLSQGHRIFKELEQSLVVLAQELSGTGIESASQALQDIGDRLNAVALALPAEAVLLGGIGDQAKQACAILKLLSSHIQMITIVARSARIEAASFDGERQSFLDFTREAFELGQAAQRCVEACARDGLLLVKAVEDALARQKEFDGLYRAELAAVASGLIAARADLTSQQLNGARLTAMARTSANRIAAAIAEAIVALQSGDATRQRLDHICDGLGGMTRPAPSLVPAASEPATWLIGQVEAGQLKDTKLAFDQDLARTVGSLGAITCDTDTLLKQRRALYGGKTDESSSFLVVVRQQ